MTKKRWMLNSPWALAALITEAFELRIPSAWVCCFRNSTTTSRVEKPSIRSTLMKTILPCSLIFWTIKGMVMTVP